MNPLKRTSLVLAIALLSLSLQACSNNGCRGWTPVKSYEQSKNLTCLYRVQPGTLSGTDESTRVVKFSHDSQSLYTLTTASHLQEWNANTGEELTGCQSNCPTARAEPDARIHLNQELGYIGFSSYGSIYNSTTAQNPIIESYTNPITYLENLDVYAIADKEQNTILIHHRKTGQLITQQPLNQTPSHISAGKNSYATALTDNSITLWPLNEQTKLTTLKGHTSNIITMQYSDDGNLIATADNQGNIIIWNTKDGTQQQQLQIPVSQVIPSIKLDIHPNNQLIVTDGSDDNVTLWSIKTGEIIAQIKSKGILTLDISPDGTKLALGKVYSGTVSTSTRVNEQRNTLNSGVTLIIDISGIQP